LLTYLPLFCPFFLGLTPTSRNTRIVSIFTCTRCVLAAAAAVFRRECPAGEFPPCRISPKGLPGLQDAPGHGLLNGRRSVADVKWLGRGEACHLPLLLRRDERRLRWCSGLCVSSEPSLRCIQMWVLHGDDQVVGAEIASRLLENASGPTKNVNIKFLKKQLPVRVHRSEKASMEDASRICRAGKRKHDKG